MSSNTELKKVHFSTLMIQNYCEKLWLSVVITLPIKRAAVLDISADLCKQQVFVNRQVYTYNKYVIIHGIKKISGGNYHDCWCTYLLKK